MKAMAIKAAVMRAIGTPFMAFGMLYPFILSLMQAKRTMTTKKPIDVPKPLAREVRKSREESLFVWTTPRTAQLVVINGR